MEFEDLTYKPLILSSAQEPELRSRGRRKRKNPKEEKKRGTRGPDAVPDRERYKHVSGTTWQR